MRLYRLQLRHRDELLSARRAACGRPWMRFCEGWWTRQPLMVPQPRKYEKLFPVHDGAGWGMEALQPD